MDAIFICLGASGSMNGCEERSVAVDVGPPTTDDLCQEVFGRWMISAIKGLRHVGIFTNDLENIVAFYQDVDGLKISHRSDRGVFISSDPERGDHEVVFFRAPEGQAPTKTQQLSLRVKSVDDVLNYYKTFKRLGVPIQSTVSHGAGVSCYFMDPEGRRTEVFADVPSRVAEATLAP